MEIYEASLRLGSKTENRSFPILDKHQDPRLRAERAAQSRPAERGPKSRFPGCGHLKLDLGGGFNTFFIFIPIPGEKIPHLTTDGLVQPPTSN